MQCHFHPQKVKNVLNTYHCGLQANQVHHSNAVSFQCQMQSNISSPFLCTSENPLDSLAMQCMGKYKRRLTYSSQNILSQQSELVQKNVIKSVESTASCSKEWGFF